MVAETNLNRVEVLISKSSIGSNISHCEFFSLDNVLQNYDDMKKKSKILIQIKFQNICKTVLCRGRTESKIPQGVKSKKWIKSKNGYIKLWYLRQ